MAHLTITPTTTGGAPRTTPPPPNRVTSRLLRRGWVAAVGLAVLWGAVAGLLTPRSPQTTAAALGSIVVSLAVGLAAGLLTRSRWAMLVAPVVFAVAFEITRMPLDGPTVDAPHLSTYGVFAFVVGRGFHAMLSLLPMALGPRGVRSLSPVATDTYTRAWPQRAALDGRDGIRGRGHRDHPRGRPTGVHGSDHRSGW